MGATVSAGDEVFNCQKCGHCCLGRGGIVLSVRDLARLAQYLGLSEEEVVRNYAELANGKLKIRPRADGYCVFFKAELGCGVHEGKPDVCRAWPFFRGNLIDRISLDLARDYCPGIRADADFETFGRAGLAYLEANGLLADGDSGAANSLIIDKQALAANWKS